MAQRKTFKDLLIHISIITTVIFFLGYLFFYIYLPSVTHHNESISVPDLNGQTVEKTIEYIEKLTLQYKIFDSTYMPGLKSSKVINQFPKAGEKVKSNRTIYITINTTNPPEINMPNLIGASYKSAEMSLKSYGLVLGEVKYKAGSSQGAVLAQLDEKNNIISEGKIIKKGTVINLLVSSGLGYQEVILPNITGYSLFEAQRIIHNLGLEIGSVVYDDNSEQNSGMIFKQKPSNSTNDSTVKVKSGEIIDLWISGSNQN